MSTPKSTKDIASIIKEFCKDRSIPIKHCASLELASKLQGFRDLHESQKAILTNPPSIHAETKSPLEILQDLDLWAEYPPYGREDWNLEVREGNTQRSYWDWAFARLDEDLSEALKPGLATIRLHDSKSGILILDFPSKYHSQAFLRKLKELDTDRRYRSASDQDITIPDPAPSNPPKNVSNWKLLRGSSRDQRVWAPQDQERPTYLFLADHSGDGSSSIGNPNATDDGPLAWEIPHGACHPNRIIQLSPSKHSDHFVANLDVESTRTGRKGTVGIEEPLALWLQQHYGCRVVLNLRGKCFELIEASFAGAPGLT